MSKGYDDFFKAARQSKAPSNTSASPDAQQFKIQKPKVQQQGKKVDSVSRPTTKQRSISDAEIRAHMKSKSKPAKTSLSSKFPPFKATLILTAIFGVLGFGYSQPETVESWMSMIEISPMSQATAADVKPADATKAAADKSATNSSLQAKTAETSEKGNGVACVEPSEMSEEDLSHFKRLSDRKKELDLREQELNALEEELHKQRDEVEARIVKLESIRGDISTVLKDRVEVDEERVKTLVEFYSNMKPKQAADIFSNLNEDLAVEVLGKMKKKNAAEIMNLLPPEKARTLSEKFTGYKRR